MKRFNNVRFAAWMVWVIAALERTTTNAASSGRNKEMKAKLLLLATLLIFGFLVYAWTQHPDGTPDVMCAPNHKDAKHRCQCADRDPDGCRGGKRTRERNPEDGAKICAHDCYMATCGCCRT